MRSNREPKNDLHAAQKTSAVLATDDMYEDVGVH